MFPKRTCSSEPKIAPDGYCSSKVVNEHEEDDWIAGDYEDEEWRRKRRRRRRRDELLLSRKMADNHNQILWSFFDGRCVKYTSDNCIHTKNAFKTRQDCHLSKLYC